MQVGILEIFIWLILFCVGICAGMIIHVILRRLHRYSGVMMITHEDEKTTYALELFGEPSLMDHMNEIIFKVKTAEQPLVRE